MTQNAPKLPWLLLVLVLAAGVATSCAPNIERLEQKRNVQGLIKALDHEDPEVRRSAAQALGSIGDPRAVEPLDFMLRGGRDSLVAAKALGQIGGPRAVDSLMRALQSPTPDMQEAAVAGLVELGESGVETLIAALKEWTWVPHRQAAVRALGQMGEPAVEPLIAALKGGDGRVRGLAAEALGQIGDTRAAKPLIAAPKEEDTFMSSASAEALVAIGAPAGLPAHVPEGVHAAQLRVGKRCSWCSSSPAIELGARALTTCPIPLFWD